jgi:hypothetical protein
MITVAGVAACALFLAPSAGAFFNPLDLLAPVGSLFKKEAPKAVTLEADIKLNPEGDLNKNGQIDSGDTVTFSYKITNTTDKSYPYSTLKTNVPKEKLNELKDTFGMTGIIEDGHTVTVPNLRVLPNGIISLEFDADINFTDQTDISIRTEAELVDETGSSVTKSSKKEVKAKKLSQEEFDKYVNIKREAN